MLSTISHRGPDEAGYYFDASVALGTARLCVLDLETGQQPMTDETQRWWIAFNGEIYNYKALRAELVALGHRFRSTSDTEVLLHAYMQWETAAFIRCNGAFAAAIYDRVPGSLVLARDRYGKRPLYYAEVGNTIVFASEMKAFLEFPGMQFEFDEAQHASIFALWTPLPHQSGFVGVKQVPNGAHLTIHGATRTVKSYHTMQLHSDAPFTGSVGEAIERTRDILSEAVRLRLQSDVEVATYLSGGLDSAIVTQLALQNSSSALHSFSLAFDDTEFDESDAQRALSEHLGTTHTEVRVRHGDIARTFPLAIWHAETPAFRTAFVPMMLLSRAVSERGIKVVLTGEGADESFLGYDIFKETLLRSTWSAARDSGALRKLYPYLAHFQDQNVKALAAVFTQFSEEKSPGLFSHELRFHNSMFGLRLLKERRDGLADLKAFVEASEAAFSALGLVERAQWLEWKTLLPGYLLSTQGDRMSMAHGVEGRCPFLDHQVVEWATRLPQELKLSTQLDEKWILKQAFADVLTTGVLAKPKQPYRAPDVSAFIGSTEADYVDALLSEQELAKIPMLDSTFCRQFLAKVRGAPTGAIGQRENQAFTLLLSVALLHRYFIKREYPRHHRSIHFVRRIDGRAV